MMHEMKNRNSNYQVNSYSRHGDNKMDKMKKMMKMSNMMNDHSSSSYHSDDNDMYDMFSEMLDSSSDRMDNYRSSGYSNQMGRMSHFKTTSTLETGLLRSWPSRSTTWRPRSAT